MSARLVPILCAFALVVAACSSGDADVATPTDNTDDSSAVESSDASDETGAVSETDDDSGGVWDGERPDDDVVAVTLPSGEVTFGELAEALPGVALDGTDLTGELTIFIGNAIVDAELEARDAVEVSAEDEALTQRLIDNGFDAEQLGADGILNQIRLAWRLGDLELLTDAEIAAEFDDNPFQYSSTCSRHILVETEAEAQEIYDLIVAGADFAETAMARSTGPSGPNGGDLGCNQPGTMVPEFDATLAETPVGEIGGPTETQFGWHVLTVYQQDPIPGEVELQTFIQQLDGASNAFLEFSSTVEVDVHPSLGTWSQEAFSLLAPPEVAIAPETSGE